MQTTTDHAADSATDDAIREYLQTLNRIEVAYASTFAHWLVESGEERAELEAEDRRGSVRQSRARTIRKAIINVVRNGR